jgi:aspartyl-tRNA(Asn)/glutamyl-tRNA(Gln) amidotransferase subunit A
MAYDGVVRCVTGTSRGILDGIPIAIKDNFCTKGVKTTASSQMLHSNTIPPPSVRRVHRLLRSFLQ